MRVLAVGQWLGTSNTIIRMEQFKYGWKATDGTGATYREPAFPDGLRTGDEPYPVEKEMTPWPT